MYSNLKRLIIVLSLLAFLGSCEWRASLIQLLVLYLSPLSHTLCCAPYHHSVTFKLSIYVDQRPEKIGRNDPSDVLVYFRRRPPLKPIHNIPRNFGSIGNLINCVMSP